ncbi:MAG: rhombosortase [Pseudomonadota bacterium]
MPEKPAIIVSTLVLLVCVCLQLLPYEMQLLLRFERAAFIDHELWRLLSGHFIHLSWNHLLLNVTGLILLLFLFESAWLAKDILCGGIFAALSISLGIYLLFPNIGWYVGLSGVLHSWFAIASVRLWPSQPRFAGILLSVLFAKLVFENISGTATDTEWLGGEVIVQAHWLGASSGLMYALLYQMAFHGLSKHA